MKMCLVVDDSRVVRKVARRILEALDFETAEASDGAEALAFCRTAMPDALEFVRTLRQEPEGGRPIVVFCAAENEPARIAEALDQGADEFIMKPFDGDIVAHKFGLAGLL